MPRGPNSRPPVPLPEEATAEDERLRVSLKKEIRARGYSVHGVEVALNWTPGYFRQQLNGSTTLKVPHMLAVFRHIGLSPREFFALFVGSEEGPTYETKPERLGDATMTDAKVQKALLDLETLKDRVGRMESARGLEATKEPSPAARPAKRPTNAKRSRREGI